MKLVTVGDSKYKIIQIVRKVNNLRRSGVYRLQQNPVVYKRKILTQGKDPKKMWLELWT